MRVRSLNIVAVLVCLSGCVGSFGPADDDGDETDTDSDTDTGDPWIDTACDECVEICDDGVDNDRDNRVDCEDSDCEGSPECVEICDDGVDNDADGHVDCEDNDCAGSSHCVEVCDDGVDNDGDGLIDCEDGDCAGFSGCTEICLDGLDNDGDGLVDCADDECWGPECHDSGVYAWVDGGAMKTRFESKILYRLDSTCGPVEFAQKSRGSGTAETVVGWLRANPKGSKGPVECQWRVEKAVFANRSFVKSFPTFMSSSVVDSVMRNGVTVDPGCGIASSASWFLPRKLRFNGGSAMTTGDTRWYSGSWADSSRKSTYGFDSACSSFWSSTKSSTKFDPLFRASSVYTMYP